MYIHFIVFYNTKSAFLSIDLHADLALIFRHVTSMPMMQLLPALPTELGSVGEVQFLAINRVISLMMDDALLVVVVVLVFFILTVRVETLQILPGENAGQDVGSDGDQNNEQGGVDVPNAGEVGNAKDQEGACELDESEELNGPPFDIRYHRHGGTFLGNHETPDCSLPNFITMQSTNTKVEEQTKEGTARNPANDAEGGEGDKHKQSLSEARPTLLFDVRDDLPLDAVLISLKLTSAQRSDMQGGLRDQTVAGRQTQNGTGDEGDAQNEKVPMVSGRFLQIIFGQLTQNARYVVIDDEQEEEHEAWHHGTKYGIGRHSLHRVGHPGTIGGWLPIPRGNNVDAVQGSHIDPGEVTQSGNNHNGNKGVVTGKDGADLTGEQHPSFGKVEGVANVARQSTKEEGGVLSGPIGAINVGLAQVERLDQISAAQVDEGNADEQLKDLRREGRYLPNEVDQADHAGQDVHGPGPYAYPEEEGEVVGIELGGQAVRRSEEDGDGSGNAHDNEGLSGEDGIYDPNNGRT
mmetsp:Transcript_13274/g.28166  ORF Transcript_13274/g.28166 Transcript_13274/m.28166 type:complete len:521 (-) Transcript_13274:794-2356(-)